MSASFKAAGSPFPESSLPSHRFLCHRYSKDYPQQSGNLLELNFSQDILLKYLYFKLVWRIHSVIPYVTEPTRLPRSRKACFVPRTTRQWNKRLIKTSTDESNSRVCFVFVSLHTATAFGQGVYFAVKSSYSFLDTYSPPNANGQKFIFIARVLTGDFTQGKHDMRAAPLRQGSDMPERYHSVVDNVKEPGVFVIFNDTQAYPQYLITCLKGPGWRLHSSSSTAHLRYSHFWFTPAH